MSGLDSSRTVSTDDYNETECSGEGEHTPAIPATWEAEAREP